jgi:signal transduction histidine kinase
VAFIEYLEGGRLGPDPHQEPRETERLRLAHDIHDGPIQTVAGAVLELELIHRLARSNDGAEPSVLGSIEDAKVATQRILDDLRSLARSLSSGSHAARIEESGEDEMTHVVGEADPGLRHVLAPLGEPT